MSLVVPPAAPAEPLPGSPWTTTARTDGDLGGWLGTGSGEPTDPAVHVLEGGRLLTLTRADLADRVAATAALLAGERRLVQVRAGNTLASLVGYLAAHAAGHVVLLTPGPGEAERTLAAAWDPDVVLDPEGTLEVRRSRPRHVLHPDLALLMSTSGSTGSPRLVRLSWDNLRSNAAAIADYLAIRPTDRAVTSLPVHYCYGLSVVHSHLAAGASVVLTDGSVADPCFWDLAREARVTTLAGVPHTFDLLDRVRFAAMDLPHLRTVTQAGGRLDPQRVVELAELGVERGFDLFVMYGQTEATARMAYLPPALAASHPHTVGIPVPGGSIDLVDGEVVYSGPNVMLGYAQEPADLALGRTVERLHTGDLGRWTDDGLLEVTGRRSRVAKVLGHRVDLDHVERTLRADGCDVRCVDGGPGLVVCAAGTPRGDLADAAARRAGLPVRCVRVLEPRDLGLDEVPRLPTGKVDYAALTGLAATAPEDAGPRLRGSLTQRFAAILGRDDVGPDDTFASLGGDSLSYVEASLHVEECVGALPRGWHVMPLRDLEGLADGHRARATGDPAPTAGWRARLEPWRALRTVETSIVLRAVAIVLIVGTHAHVFRMQGTAHALLVLVGYNLARFRMGEAPRPERTRGLLTALARVVAPTLAVVGTVHLVTGQYARRTVGLTNWLFGEALLGPDWRFWFVEALVVALLATTALLATPWGDRLQRRHPFALPLALSGLGMLWWKDVLFPPVPHMQGSALVVLWLFCLGWAAAAADGVRERLVITAVAVPTVGTFSGNPRRDLLTLAAVLLVVWVPTLRVPRALVPLLTVLASASLFVYVVHWQVLQELRGTPWTAFGAGLAAGVGAWWLWTRAGQLAGRVRSAVSRRPRRRPTTPARATRARRRSRAAPG
ncbi:non-ribosomal peptide synthetase [Oryzobacter telluris]|uniref:non-ribosomal peptide synthetase n=1 Tax=Oryzobacter telluris TaxID=3149179 RepID=UPI00370DA3DA